LRINADEKAAAAAIDANFGQRKNGTLDVNGKRLTGPERRGAADGIPGVALGAFGVQG
jgi:hypothetical protein